MINKLLFVIIVIACSSCTGLRTVSREDPLYTGPAVTLSGDISKERQKQLETGIETGLRPLPNGTFMKFFRPRLAIFHLAREAKPEGRGFRHWLKYQVGEPPVSLSKVDLLQSKELVKQYLADNGFFNPVIIQDVEKKRKKASVNYVIAAGPEFKISAIEFPRSDSLIKKMIASNSPASYVRTGDPYNLKILKRERERIDSTLKNSGFFYFQPDFLLFKADTSGPGNTVKLSLDLKNDIPYDAEKRMVINSIVVNSEYTDISDTAMLSMDTVTVDGIQVVINNPPLVKPEVIAKAIGFRPGKEYKIRDHDRTLTRLTALGLFKFVNITFAETDTAKSNTRLDCYINLTPLHRRTLRLELQGVTKSNNFAGPVLALSYRNRNLFRRAELFQVNLNTSFQTQIRQRQAPLNSYELSSSAGVYIPRIVAPFAKVRESRLFTPRTKFEVGTGIFNRVDFYSLISVSGTYGYQWQESFQKTHELNPIAINFLDLTSRTDRFQELLDRNLLLRNSFEEQFIIGSNYTFLYKRLSSRVPYNYYLMSNIDLSGNSASLVERLIGKNPFSFAGLTYSQYSRLENDARFYYDLTRKLKFATRLIVGVGIPYGNSETLPYIKQFFSGGSNSIRAFAPRTVGPGVYSPTFDRDLAYFEQGGELKLEHSVELRYALTKIIKPAIFIDAGNVWMLNENAEFPGGEFKFGEFANQLAVGAGAGLRLDVSILVLRFDLAFPIMTPNRYRLTANGNGARTGTLGSNYVLNVALGYPF